MLWRDCAKADFNLLAFGLRLRGTEFGHERTPGQADRLGIEPGAEPKGRSLTQISSSLHTTRDFANHCQKFTDVGRPVVFGELFPRRRRRSVELPSFTPVEFFEQVLSEKTQIVHPLAQGGMAVHRAVRT